MPWLPALLAWFALMAWVLFDRSSYVSLSLTFVSVLFLVAMAVPFALSLIWRKYQMPYERHEESVPAISWSEARNFTAPMPQPTCCCR